MVIDVQKADIFNGVHCSHENCPIATATLRTVTAQRPVSIFGLQQWHMPLYVAVLPNRVLVGCHFFDLPVVAEKFIYSFDTTRSDRARRVMKPFAFEI